MKRLTIFIAFLVCFIWVLPSYAGRDGRYGPIARVFTNVSLPSNEQNTDPDANDDASKGYKVGDLRINESADTVWECVDNTIGSALWIPIGSGSPYYRVNGTFSVHDSSGATIFQVDPSENMAYGNEVLGGVSTFGISGDLDINSSSDAYLITAGRPIELRNTTPQTFRLPDMDSLSGVTNVAYFVDTTLSTEDSPGSGVTAWSPTNKIIAGVGSTADSGDTIFVNSGNTGFILQLKAVNAGSGVTPIWKVWSFNGDVLRRP